MARSSAAALVAASAMVSAALPPAYGPYEAASKMYAVPALDTTGQEVHLFYPSNASGGERFPFISYAHGMYTAGKHAINMYDTLLTQLASFGFVVADYTSCGSGIPLACRDKVNAPYTDCAGLPAVSPAAWSSYYGEQLKVIEWARNQTRAADPILALVDWEAGVGVSGHSMGGQATALSAHPECAARWGIKAAVLHHAALGDTPAGNIGANISVPLAAFTTSGDSIWKETRDMYEAAPVTPKVYRDQTGYSHNEPSDLPMLPKGTYNPSLATFTAAWFKVYLSGDKAEYYDMIYDKSSPVSLCNYANMTECILDEQ